MIADEGYESISCVCELEKGHKLPHKNTKIEDKKLIDIIWTNRDKIL